MMIAVCDRRSPLSEVITGPPRVVVVDETWPGSTVVGGALVVAGALMLGAEVVTVEGDAATVVADVVNGETTVLDEAMVLVDPAVVGDGSSPSDEQAAGRIMTNTIPHQRPATDLWVTQRRCVVPAAAALPRRRSPRTPSRPVGSEQDPVARRGLVSPNAVMVYAQRHDFERQVVEQLVRAS